MKHDLKIVKINDENSRNIKENSVSGKVLFQSKVKIFREKFM